MSCSIPVIATDVGGTSEIVNNENGFLIESNQDALKIVEIINKFKCLTLEEKIIKENRLTKPG